jgi:phage tail protein X
MPRTFLVPQGSVWDWLSWKLYGDESFVHTLLAANPTLRHIVVFEESATITVPDKPETRASSSVNLPPWKQA